MTKLNRRRFITSTGASVAAFQAADAFRDRAGATGRVRRFYTVLSLERLGFSGTFEQSVKLAHSNGLEAVDPDVDLFGRLPDEGLKRLLDDLASRNLRLGAAGLPVEFRKDEATFTEDLKRLPHAAKSLERV